MRGNMGTIMRLNRRGIAIGGLALALVVAASVVALKTTRSDWLAKAGGEEVRAEDFRREYIEYLLATGLQDAPQHRMAMLQDMIGARLLIKEAKVDGIESTEAYQDRRALVARKLQIDAYIQQALLDTLRVTESEVREAFVRSQTQVWARHLYARTREEADALRARLRRGESFDALALEVFQDTLLRNSGGRLPPFTFDEMDVAFEDAAFTLPIGEDSEPVQTAQGYSILRVEDRFTKPLITEQEFIEKRPQFETYVGRRKAEAARRDHVQQIASANTVALLDPGAERLLDQITGRSIELGGTAEALQDSDPLLRYGDTEWSVGDFRERARIASARQRGQVTSRGSLEAFAQGLVVNDRLAARAAALGLADSVPVQEALARAMDEYILEQAGAALDATVTVPEDSVRAYYASAPPTEFLLPEAVEVAVQTYGLATEALSQANTAAFVNSRFDYYTRRELGVWGDTVFAAVQGAILGPVESEGAWAVIAVGQRREARSQTFDESREQIHAMLRTQAIHQNRRSAYEDLATEYQIRIDEDRLMRLPLN